MAVRSPLMTCSAPDIVIGNSTWPRKRQSNSLPHCAHFALELAHDIETHAELFIPHKGSDVYFPFPVKPAPPVTP